MSDRILSLLQEIVRITDSLIIDECPRHESEPFISIWEKTQRLAQSRSSEYLLDPVSGDYRKALHATPDDVVARLEALRDGLSLRNPKSKGTYGEIAAIEKEINGSLTFS